MITMTISRSNAALLIVLAMLASQTKAFPLRSLAAACVGSRKCTRSGCPYLRLLASPNPKDSVSDSDSSSTDSDSSSSDEESVEDESESTETGDSS